MKRMWLTDQQAETLRRALNNQVFRLQKVASQEEDLGLRLKYLNEVDDISDIIDIIDL